MKTQVKIKHERPNQGMIGYVDGYVKSNNSIVFAIVVIDTAIYCYALDELIVIPQR